MPRTTNKKDYLKALKRLSEEGSALGPPPNRHIDDWEQIPDLNTRIQAVLGLTRKKQRNATDMLFFVMYDIESNKVRRCIVKYLENKGCTRVQKSIFLADLSMEKYQAIRNELAQVQAAYDNQDSILIVPITTDYLKAMRVIGKNIDMDIITHARNTLFF